MEENRTSISTNKFDPLEVELMRFRFMPKRRQVSLILPASTLHEQVRIINMAPGTALNLLKWLEQQRQNLEQLHTEEEER